MPRATPPSPERKLISERKLLLVREAAEVSGVSIHTVYAWVRRGYLPVVRIDAGGGRKGITRIRPDDLDKLIRDHTYSGIDALNVADHKRVERDIKVAAKKAGTR